MDRRELLTYVFEKKHTRRSTKIQDELSTSLSLYTGEWTKHTAAHLLRRTTFGPNNQDIIDAHTEGMDATIAKLLVDNPLPPNPINYNFENDPNTPIGESWVNKPHDGSIMNLNSTRKSSLLAWQMGLFNEGGVSIREKMVLFWHNHFVTASINLAGYNFQYLDILRRHATGNFRTMTEEITVSPSMLLYLNGHQNSRQAPNENYARELLELFTIGKGDVAGPGDYTNYTEDDVVALAKALTGWRANNNEEFFGSIYVSNRHDTSDKQLSPRLNNTVITNGDEEEYKTVIDIILQQSETARYICRRIYIWFVGANIDPELEANIIEPMANILRDNDYEVKPVIEALLKSEHFYHESVRGCMINHPLDFFFKLFNSLEVSTPDDILKKYDVWRRIFRDLLDHGMVILNHPSVAGWKAFYQGPQYYDVWANSVSLPQRERMTEKLINGQTVNGTRFGIDTLAVVSKIENASDPTDLIINLTNLLFANPISAGQVEFLKNILIPGLPDFEWTVEYGEYLGDPTNDDKRLAVENKLIALFNAILKMPEIYLI